MSGYVIKPQLLVLLQVLLVLCRPLDVWLHLKLVVTNRISRSFGIYNHPRSGRTGCTSREDEFFFSELFKLGDLAS